jgi:uncharacterized protein
METIQIRLTKELLEKANGLVKKGLYSNKSEVIRDALRRLLYNDILKTEKERMFNVLYSSDFHGNSIQYNKFFKKAFDDKVNALILGGDLTPKDKEHRTIKDQRIFLEKELLPSIKEFNKKNKERNHECKVFLILGNDDFRVNSYVLRKYENEFKYFHNRILKFYDRFKIAGYSFVPLTPFVYKDWEKLDLNNKNENKTRKGFKIKGKVSKGTSFIYHEFNIKKRDNTIENDLIKLFDKEDPKNIILVCHTPPANTSLDINSEKEHVGSAALRKIIENKQPLLTLHGHVHESVEISGKFFEKIGKTISVSSGNNNIGSKLAVIKFNIFKPEEIIREII